MSLAFPFATLTIPPAKGQICLAGEEIVGYVTSIELFVVQHSLTT